MTTITESTQQFVMPSDQAVVLKGNIDVALAGIYLVTLKVNLMIASIEAKNMR